MYYPNTWLELDAELFADSEYIKEMSEETGLSEEMMASSLQQVTVMFFDFANASEEFVPNLNIVREASGGMTAQQLTNILTITMLKGQVEEQFTATFNDFAWVVEPAAKKWGGHDVVFLATEYGMGAGKNTALQAMAVGGDALYTLTYSIGEGTDVASYEALFEQIVSLLEI